MAKLILIRHAETRIDKTLPASLWKLESSAQKACQELTKKLEPFKLKRIIASEEFKARETGHLLAKRLEIPCISAPDLHEHRRSEVRFMGKQKWLETLQTFFNKPDELIFGDETANEALERFDKAVRKTIKTYPDEVLAIVSHGTVMSLFLARYNIIKVFEFWQSIKMPDAFVLSPDFAFLDRLD